MQKQRRGPPPSLEAEEEHVVSWVKEMASMGFPVHREALLDVGRRLSKVERRSGNPRAEEITSGKKWLRLFLQRHPDITLRTPEHLSNGQASVTESDIRTHLEKIETRLRNEGASDVLDDPSRIFNTDESGVALNPSGRRVLAARGTRQVGSRGGSDKENVTVLVTGSAAGALAPTAILLKRKRLPPALTDLVGDDFCLLKNNRGWMTGATFLEYLENNFKPYLLREEIKLPVALFLDNHSSHLTDEVTAFCKQNEILLLPLLPNATHIMQPLDVAVFKPLKSLWYRRATSWRLNHGGRPMRKDEFIGLFQETFTEFNPDWLIAGFRASGIHPWNPNAIDYCRLCAVPSPAPAQTPETSRGEASPMPFLVELEERMTIEQLTLFQENIGEWEGPERMRDLYKIWLVAEQEARGASAASRSLDTSNDENIGTILSLPTPHNPKPHKRRRRVGDV